ncbi:alpha-l-fucosidase [Flagelloscypha sp. PMI_526]|nr:alpha-l-fucosidase [Flagelloscypha sp. PMI_526]
MSIRRIVNVTNGHEKNMLAPFILAFAFLTKHVHGYPETKLWFNTSATLFTDAILLGNGRLGASLWAGGPYVPVNPEAAAYIPQARELIQQNLWVDAQKLLNEQCMAVPIRQTQYQTSGSLLINMTEPTIAVSTTSYSLNGVTYTRQAFVSAPKNVLVVKLSATSPGSLNFTISLNTPTPIVDLTATTDQITLNGHNTEAQNGLPGVMTYQDRIKIYTVGGTSKAVATEGLVEAHTEILGADEITLVLGVTTSFVKYDDGSSANPAERLDAIFQAIPSSGHVYDALLAEHIASHKQYFNRFSVDLDNVAEYSALPTDLRIARGRQGGDPGLISLFINFGRYLLISSSQPGSLQPANLQGIWQYDLNSAWQSKFTVNINIEMNYWPAETTGLGDTIEPLITLLEDVAVTGAHTAQVMYNASTVASTPNGLAPWVLHHNTDQWRATAPVDDAYYGFWPAGGAWQLQTLYEHLLFNPSDHAFAKRIYPLFQGAFQFFLETLQVYPNNTEWLVTNPSLSPERAHHDSVSVTQGPTLDNALLRDLFGATAALAKMLNIDAEFAANITATAAKLPPFQLTSAGALMEWIEDYQPQPPVFSHISPMYPLYPGSQIDPRLNTTWSDAAKVYLTYRGDGSFGWPVAWRVGTWARLLDGEHVYSEIKLLLSNTCVWPSLQGKNSVFQIDANLGGAGGLIEMFVQSHNGEIHLLPALPSLLSTGKVTGIRARGGFEVDVSWSSGTLTSATLKSTVGNAATVVRLTSSTKTVSVQLGKGAARKFTAADFQ